MTRHRPTRNNRPISRRKKDRTHQLEQTVALIQQRWGPAAIRKANEAQVATGPAVIPTGFAGLDELLGIGGLPKGRICEVIAAGTAGQMTLVTKVMASSQRVDEQVVYVDAHHAIDLDLMARCGVRFDSLVVLRPYGFAHALEMASDLIRGGGAGLVVFDRLHPILGDGEMTALSTALREWAPLLHQARSTLLFISEVICIDWYPEGVPLPYFCSVRLAFHRQEWVKRRHRVTGFTTRITVLKNKLGPSRGSVDVRVPLYRAPTR